MMSYSMCLLVCHYKLFIDHVIIFFCFKDYSFYYQIKMLNELSILPLGLSIDDSRIRRNT